MTDHMQQEQYAQETQRTGLEVAVVGMTARMPGAPDLETFWNNLVQGKECISFFSAEELEEAGIESSLLRHPAYVKAKGVLEDIEYFDAAFFDYSPRQAGLMDPQIRLFHECCWEALEHAGYVPGEAAGAIGLFAGANANLEWIRLNAANFGGDPAEQFEAGNINSRDYLCTQAAYKLNLTGPAVTVQTACSTSLTAIHYGWQALVGGECDLALAGGISITLPKKSGYIYQEGMVHSPDGRCRAFDAAAGGTVGGDGVGIVVLKRLQEALRDRDTIHAVLLGSAVNNDGSRKVDFTAPSVKGQAEVIRAAHRAAGVDPESISYVETHGTGTALGDPIEIRALTQAFDSKRKSTCAIGAVKTNIGHLITGAGVAGFIKTVLALKHRLIPPSLHYTAPNPAIDFETGPFFVNDRAREWEPMNGFLRAGVSSFGIGGTNAHAVLEAAPPEAPVTGEQTGGPHRRGYHLFPFSARNRKALAEMPGRLAEALGANPGLPLERAEYTLQVGRKAFEHRGFTVCPGDASAAAGVLDDPHAMVTGGVDGGGDQPPVVFMFSGQGAQYVNMGRGLYRTEPVFRRELDRCFEVLAPIMGTDPRELLYPGWTDGPGGGDEAAVKQVDEAASARINETAVTQPLLVALELSLARLLMSWGIRPGAMIGHSIGEYTAACLSGVLTLEDALVMVAFRGKWMQRMPGGAMLSVSLPEERVVPLLGDELSPAAVNGASLCVVSGPYAAVDELETRLKGDGRRCVRLHTSHAFHSPMMEPVMEQLEGHARSIALQAPTIPYISNLTGAWITAKQARDPRYWADHMRGAVRFAAGLGPLLEGENTLLIEVGPGKALATFAREHPDKKDGQEILNLVRHPKETVSDVYFLLGRLGLMWLRGLDIDWNAFHHGRVPGRVPLPSYPFQRQKYWPEGGGPGLFAPPSHSPGASPRKKGDPADWFYIPSWRRTRAPLPRGPEAADKECFLVLVPAPGTGGPETPATVLVQCLRDRGHRVVTVRPGPAFAEEDTGGTPAFTLPPAGEEGYRKVLDRLAGAGLKPTRAVHLWNLAAPAGDSDVDLETGYYALLALARAFDAKKESLGLSGENPLRLTVFTANMQEVVGDDLLYPERAALLGPVLVLPQEYYPYMRCGVIDVDGRGPLDWIEAAAAELERGPGDDRVVAFRGRHRLVRDFVPERLGAGDALVPRLKSGGVYLVTGGLGGIGLVLAERLVREVSCRFVLVGRSGVPGPGPRQLADLGAEVMTAAADVADEEQMAGVLARARERFGRIDGVIHAAGVPDGALVRGRSDADSQRVFRPKVLGARVLERLFRGADLDFMVFCSSLMAVDGQVGQVAYCAANAVLDAHAYYRSARESGLTCSIAWDGWSEVGMAVRAAAPGGPEGTLSTEPDAPEGPGRPVNHPLLDRRYDLGDSGVLYVTRLDPAAHWVLEEHRIAGRATLPGTAYLEMCHAAVTDVTGASACTIEELVFLSPLAVDDGVGAEIEIVVERRGDHLALTVRSRAAEGPGGLQVHASGSAAVLEIPSPVRLDPRELESRCTAEIDLKKDEPGGAVVFGPRWNTLKQVRAGDGCGLAVLELDPAFGDDLRDYRLHPALMDFATSFIAGGLDTGAGVLPFSYRGVRVTGPLPRKVYSWITHDYKDPGQRDSLTFDVTVMDETGLELIHINAFTMRAFETSSPTLPPAGQSGVQGEPPPGAPRAGAPGGPPEATGLRSSEGADVFMRVLGDTLPQVAISTVDLAARRVEREALLEEYAGESVRTVPKGRARYPRPMLETPYVEPGAGRQRELAAIWGELLGIESVGADDDFFQLGGDSLKAITVTGKIHKHMAVEIPVSELFSRPTVRGLALYIEQLGGGGYRAIEAVERREYYPQSPAQKRLFILDRFENIGTSYNTPIVYRFRGRMDRERTDRVEETFRRLIRRHEMLRTSFAMLGDRPVQRVHEDVEFRLERLPRQGGGVRELVDAFIRPFDLSVPPLLRAGLAPLEGGEWLILLDLHHIVADGTSVGLLMEDFTALFRDGGGSLPPLEVQYKDYTMHLRGLSRDETHGAREAYWLSVFPEAGAVPPLDLPTDFPRPREMNYSGAVYPFTLSAADTEALGRLCTSRGATHYMVLLAVFNLLLHKYTGSGDIVVGTNVAGRSHADTARILGMFANALAMRNHPRPEITFAQFLEEVKQNSVKAFENQDMQFEDLIGRLNLDREVARNPLFDVVFNAQTFAWTAGDGEAEGGGGETGGTGEIAVDGDAVITPVEVDTGTAKFDIIFFVDDVSGEAQFHMEYSTALFTRETIARMAERFIEIIRQVTADDTVLLKDIKITQDLMETESTISDAEFRF